MKINEDEAHLRVEIGSGGQMRAQIGPKRKIDVLIGDAAKMDCQRAINYIKSGTAEIDKAVEEGIEEIEQKVEGMANVDLSNLSATGEAKLTTLETNAKNYADSLARNYATAAQGALADTAVQPADLATVATTGEYSDLSGTPTLAAVATSGSYDDLSNKPSIPAAQVNSDWNATSGVAQILNKPSLAAVATSGAYADLSGTPDLSAKANTDLSNLDEAGQKVIDGQWVYSELTVFNNTALTTTHQRYSLASYLPDDGYDYEVFVHMGTSNSAAANIASDLGFVIPVRGASSGSAQLYDVCILPVGSGRYIEAYTTSGTSSNSVCVLRGYRRIGTNS
ncbi:MAG: hypothetical protein IJS26_03860 [Alphaproteobacteria bacterium]|nr:hypothetical protein [Alphaproteobacteria bacterium]